MHRVEIENWIAINGGSLKHISNSHALSNWKYPISIDPIEKILNVAYKNQSMTKKLFCAFLKNVYVINGKVIDQSLKNEILEFSKCGDFDVSKNDISVYNAIHLVDRWGGTNYWHWISTCLAKLSLTDAVYPNVYFIINSLRHGFVRESLIKMGIDLSKCIEIDKVKSVFCKNLIAPSPIGDGDKEGILFLRNKLRNKSTGFAVKIYISRKENRRIENENEVIPFLKEFGFTFFRCEELSFNEQVELFSSAEAVIAPHGAGLTNLIFVPDNAKILELRSPKYFGSCYWKLCNHLNLSYYSLFGEGTFPETIGDLSRDLYANININLAKLEKTLKLMGI